MTHPEKLLSIILDYADIAAQGGCWRGWAALRILGLFVPRRRRGYDFSEFPQ